MPPPVAEFVPFPRLTKGRTAIVPEGEEAHTHGTRLGINYLGVKMPRHLESNIQIICRLRHSKKN